jgi:V/A-type H+-transporting ATPase subunit K
LIGAGLLGGAKEVTVAHGLVMLGSGLIVAITGISAIMQGLVASAGISSCAKNKDAFVPSIVFTGQCETPAIFGFIISVIVLVIGLAIF